MIARPGDHHCRSLQEGVFAPKPAAAGEKVDRRKLCTPKLKRGPRLSNEELIARGLSEYAR